MTKDFTSFSQSTKIKKGSKGDTSVLKPTLMAAVPVSLFDIAQIHNSSLMTDVASKSKLILVLSSNKTLSSVKLGVFSADVCRKLWIESTRM